MMTLAKRRAIDALRHGRMLVQQHEEIACEVEWQTEPALSADDGRMDRGGLGLWIPYHVHHYTAPFGKYKVFAISSVELPLRCSDLYPRGCGTVQSEGSRRFRFP